MRLAALLTLLAADGALGKTLDAAGSAGLVEAGLVVVVASVRGGGPADKAGLNAGDIIVHFAGKKITNIYDYTYALDAVKIGKPVEVEVLRKGKRVKLSVTPGTRK